MAASAKQSVLNLRKRLRQWALRRRNPQEAIVLNRQNLFIFPTGSGLGLLAVMVLMWLLGTNYDNNLVLSLAFFLASLFVVSILQTHASLAGIEISSLKSKPCFAGDETVASLRLRALGRRDHPDVRLQWAGNVPLAISLPSDHAETVDLPLQARRRGSLPVPLLRIESCYPLGLIRCWSWLRLDMEVLAYPKPQAAGPLPSTSHSSDQGDTEPVMAEGAEDFSGFHSYREGESLRHVSWKHYAQGKGLFVKEFQAYAEQSLWLDWDFLPGLDRENRLQRLCYWALQLAEGKQPYGLRLPGLEIAPDIGPAHRQNVLLALAQFEQHTLPEPDTRYWQEGVL
ncbi:MAG: DUF58 domain-containing protein [Cellvibrionaceae bacterium]|nr:DUF58 domain-containing protein [Cellvibrionaceae bacterium]